MRVVTLSPSRPASGQSLTEKVMARVGGSTGWRGSGSVDVRLADRVGDGGVLRPAMATMSPASASSTGTRSRPRKASSLVMRACSISLAVAAQRLQDGVGPDRRRTGCGRSAGGRGRGRTRASSTSMRNGLSASTVRRRHMAHDQVEQRRQVLALGLERGRRPALAAGGEQASGSRAARRWRSSAANRSKTSLCTSCGARVGRSTLLITHDRPQAEAQRLAEHELGLRHRPFGGVDQQRARRRPCDRMRSTSPPKSAWPGVSTMLMRVPFQTTEVPWPGW